MNINNLLKKLDLITNISLQEQWDNSGYQIIVNNDNIEKIVLSLDITEEVIDFAIENKSNLIISHHPLIFSGIKSIHYKNYIHRIIIKAIQNNINIISYHTNIDKNLSGLADYFCKKLGLINVSPLSGVKYLEQYKVVTFIPEDYVKNILEYLNDKNLSIIGAYKVCSFITKGTGTFFPFSSSNPFFGEKNKLNKVDEYRIEFVLNDNYQTILEELKNIHPYEKPVFDVYKLENREIFTGSLGRTGYFEKSLTLGEILEKIKKIFNLKTIKYTGKTLDTKINKIAICPGSGMSLLKDVIKAKADLYITGDVKYHDALDASFANINIIDIGHFNSEFIFTELMGEIISEIFNGTVLIYKQKDIFKNFI